MLQKKATIKKGGNFLKKFCIIMKILFYGIITFLILKTPKIKINFLIQYILYSCRVLEHFPAAAMGTTASSSTVC
jgi:hypothetical protein